MPNAIRKLGRLYREGRLGLFFEALALLLWIRLALASSSVPRLRRGLARWSRWKARRVVDTELETTVLWATGQAVRYVPGSLGLPRALMAQTLLARRGLASELRVGILVGPDGSIGAHAWLESDGRALSWGEGSPTAHRTIPFSMIDRRSS